jgi:hypothetical protein
VRLLPANFQIADYPIEPQPDLNHLRSGEKGFGPNAG